MVLLPYMNWGNLKLFLRQCKLVEANNPQVPLGMWDFVPIKPPFALAPEFVPPEEWLWHSPVQCDGRRAAEVPPQQVFALFPTRKAFLAVYSGCSEGRKLSPLIRLGAQVMHPKIILRNKIVD